jgi:hypothetical protein
LLLIPHEMPGPDLSVRFPAVFLFHMAGILFSNPSSLGNDWGLPHSNSRAITGNLSASDPAQNSGAPVLAGNSPPPGRRMFFLWFRFLRDFVGLS